MGVGAACLATAVAVSSLWAVWHLPIAAMSAGLWTTIIALLFVHLAVGVPLSLYWRRSGNLFVPATAHAVVDAVRNALQ
jgi:membrane protease YdiL (CAAX protease family)